MEGEKCNYKFAPTTSGYTIVQPQTHSFLDIAAKCHIGSYIKGLHHNNGIYILLSFKAPSSIISTGLQHTR